MMLRILSYTSWSYLWENVLFVGKSLFFKDVAYIMFIIFHYTKLSCRPRYQQWTIRKWNKENNPIAIASEDDKTLRNKSKQGVERFYAKSLRHWYKKFKELKIREVRLSIQRGSWGRICISKNFLDAAGDLRSMF